MEIIMLNRKSFKAKRTRGKQVVLGFIVWSSTEIFGHAEGYEAGFIDDDNEFVKYTDDPNLATFWPGPDAPTWGKPLAVIQITHPTKHGGTIMTISIV
jgi:hypothetical protein